jgi:hypothetical protein
MSLPVSKFLESLARQVLELQVNLNSVCRNGPRLSLSPLQTELQRLAVSQTCLKSSEDKGIIDARKGTHSPRLVVSQACLIIDDIPDNSFMDMLVTSQPLDPQADGLEGADHGGDVQVCDEMGERRLRVDIASSPATGRTHRHTATGILHDVLTIGQYATLCPLFFGDFLFKKKCRRGHIGVASSFSAGAAASASERDFT